MKPLTFLIIGTFLCAGCAGTPPANLGVTDGRLSPCPDTPNCVNSQSPGTPHYIAPIAYEGKKNEAYKRLRRVITSMPRAKITKEKPDYLRTEFTSLVMRFVDDVEFYFPEAPVIHVRSASRVGYSDLGVNRKRIETIREQFGAIADGGDTTPVE
ncbi:MAG: DUF1499 domain-containing protein [Thermodesulfobacteriota bacterium]|nr:DUF1499 domain-containing protein [Thermodesulfobacteriota bacterium]